MIHEYRKYVVMPGRMDALHESFILYVLPLFERHGIRPTHFWESVIGRTNELHYILEWDNLAEREERWAAFYEDPDWLSALKTTRSPDNGGQIVYRVESEIWRTTSYSK
jgi:hypothetical protein